VQRVEVLPQDRTGRAGALYYDVTEEPVPSQWTQGVDPDPENAGRPTGHDLVEPARVEAVSRAMPGPAHLNVLHGADLRDLPLLPQPLALPPSPSALGPSPFSLSRRP